MAGQQSRLNGKKGGRPPKLQLDWEFRQCRKCGLTKPRDAYYKAKKGAWSKYYWRSICKECHKATTKRQCKARDYVSSYETLWQAMKLLCAHKVSDAEKILYANPPKRIKKDA